MTSTQLQLLPKPLNPLLGSLNSLFKLLGGPVPGRPEILTKLLEDGPARAAGAVLEVGELFPSLCAEVIGFRSLRHRLHWRKLVSLSHHTSSDW